MKRINRDITFDFVCDYQRSNEILRLLRPQALITLVLLADISGGHFSKDSLKWYLPAYLIATMSVLGWFFFFRVQQPTRILVNGDKIELVFFYGKTRVSNIRRCNLIEPDHGHIKLIVEGKEYFIGQGLSNLDLLRELIQ